MNIYFFNSFSFSLPFFILKWKNEQGKKEKKCRNVTLPPLLLHYSFTTSTTIITAFYSTRDCRWCPTAWRFRRVKRFFLHTHPIHTQVKSHRAKRIKNNKEFSKGGGGGGGLVFGMKKPRRNKRLCVVLYVWTFKYSKNKWSAWWSSCLRQEKKNIRCWLWERSWFSVVYCLNLLTCLSDIVDMLVWLRYSKVFFSYSFFLFHLTCTHFTPILLLFHQLFCLLLLAISLNVFFKNIFCCFSLSLIIQSTIPPPSSHLFKHLLHIYILYNSRHS